ncbi:MAG: signal peptide peptidase SppA [Geminicoccaceae bacterium]
MRRFLVGTLAVIGFLAVLAIAGLVGAGYWYSTRTQETRDIPDKVMLTVDLRSSYSETSDFSPFDYFSDNAPLSISELVLALGKAATDDHVAGLFVRIAETEHGFAKAQEMLEALRHFGAGGKPTVGWADTIGEIGSGNEGYMIASALERLYVQPGGMIGLTGIAIEMPFAREFFDKIGVEPAVFRREGYKTMMDNATHTGFSPEHREMMEALLDSLYDQLVASIAENRLLAPAVVRTLVDKGPLSVEQAAEAGLIDGIEYRQTALDDFTEELGDPEIMDIAEYFHIGQGNDDGNKPGKDSVGVALIRSAGNVVRGDQDLSENIAGDTLAETIREAVEDRHIEAIILRLDTGGGSAIASETIAHEIRTAVDEGKPVIISMGNLAASGGYWIAMGASRIVAQPGTLTGSIGVIAGKPVIAGLSAKLGINWETIQRGENADMWSIARNFDVHGKAAMNAALDDIYGRFVKGVAEGRKLDVDAVERIAQGRVWTGADALDIGLVDRLGGIPEAIDEARSLLALDDGRDVRIIPWPRPKSSIERLEEILDRQFGQFAEAALIWNRLSSATGLARIPYFQIH